MKMRGLVVLFPLALMALVAFAGPPSSDKDDQAQDEEAIGLKMSEEEAYYTFKETLGRVTVYVGGQLAGLEAKHDYVPFQVAVAVRGKGPELEISRYNFELHDAYGQVHETASAADVQKDGIVQFVNEWVRQNPINLGQEVVTFRRIGSNFYPVDLGGTTDAHLDRETYLADVVYFPKPKDLHGELMLSFFSKGMEHGAINVRFKALQPKQKHKKNK